MDRFPAYKFACSQAQQYEWIARYYPSLFEKITRKVTQGQFIPVGGTWVEVWMVETGLHVLQQPADFVVIGSFRWIATFRVASPWLDSFSTGKSSFEPGSGTFVKYSGCRIHLGTNNQHAAYA